MERLKVKIVNRSAYPLPEYSTGLSAGMDIRANISDALTISPGERALVPTGLFIELPEGFEAQIRPRSGLACNHGITMLNSPGTVDADYRGEVEVLLINLSGEDFIINNGDRIGQMIISRHETVEWVATDKISPSKRGTGGFGHTGKA
ncbi:MAG: dUTP diphosphatase [Bacteroidetes bacterium]|nr:dUTP diphosphatase [Bacteroidota bacterium]